MIALKKRLSVLVSLLLLLCCMASTSEAANKTLRDAVNIDTIVKVDDSTTSYTGLNSFAVDGVERAWQQWFWYRVGSTGGEISLDKLPKKAATIQPTPSSLLITYTLAGQFDISIRYELTSYAFGAGKASLKKIVTITNTSTSSLDYHLFEYSDFDISDLGIDNLEIVGNKIFQNGDQFDSSGVTLVHDSTVQPNNYDIDSNQTYLLPEMKNDTPTNLTIPQTANSYGDDMQFAQQWDFIIPAGQSVSFSISDSIYPTLPVTAFLSKAGSCVTYGGQANYTINFDNIANTVLKTENLTNFKIIDYLPKNTTPTVNPPTDGSVYDFNANTVTWSLPTLAAGATQQTKSLSIAVNSPTDITNQVLLISDQAFPTRISDLATLCNHPPAMTAIPDATINEGTAFNYQVNASDADSGNIFTYSLSNAPSGMTISSTGVINWPASVVGTYTISVTATDSGPGNLYVSKSFTLTVKKVNKPPVITSTPITSANDNQLYTYTITATDPENDTISFYNPFGPLGMSLSGNVVSWTPTKSQLGDNQVVVMVSDGQGNNVDQSFIVTVTHVNSPPVISIATPPITTATVGAFYSYKVTATDPDGDALTYSLIANPDPVPTGMTIGTTGVIGWTPTADQNNKVHNVTAKVSDGLGGIATLSYTITVGTVTKTTPVINWSAPAAITYGTALGSTQLNATASVPGSFTYTPAAGFIPGAGNQTLSVTFTPADTASYNSASATVTLTVNKASASVTLGGLSQTYSGAAKTATAATTPAGLSVVFTYNGSATAPTAAGSYTVIGTISDANYTGSATGTMTIAKASTSITWPTPAAVIIGTTLGSTQLNATASVAGTFVYTPASGTTMNIAGNQTLSVAFTPTDSVNYSGSSATVTLTVNNKTTPVINWSAPAAITYGTALGSTQLNATASVPGSFTYTPAAGFIPGAGNQTLSVTFTPTDTASYNSASATVTLTVNKASASVTLGGLSQTYSGAAKTATAATTPAGLSVVFTYNGSATAPTAAGSYTVIGTISDANYTGSATGTMTIAKASTSITWPTPAAVIIGTTLGSTQLNATASVAGTFVYTPASGTTMNIAGNQTLSVAFTPTDSVNYSGSSATVTLTVTSQTATNQPPVITSSPVTVGYKDGYYNYQVIASDPNGDIVKFSLLTKPSGMSIDSKTGFISWRPSDNGTYSVIVRASDPLGLFTTQSFKVTVYRQPSNNSPRIISVPVLMATVGTPYTYDVDATDSDGDQIYYRLATSPTGMSIDTNTGAIGWIPSSSQVGKMKVVVEAIDSKGGKSSQGFYLSVLSDSSEVNSPPLITSIPVATASKGRVYSYVVQANDPDGDGMVFSLLSKPYGMSIDSSTGEITWKPSTTGSYKVSIRVTDSKGAYTTQTFTLTVNSDFRGSSVWERGGLPSRTFDLMKRAHTIS